MSNDYSIKDIASQMEAIKAKVVTATIMTTMSEIPKLDSSNPAEWTYKRIIEYIIDFESNLDDEHEIGARLVSFGSELTFHIQDMGFYGPDIITFYGINNQGEEVQLIQNISQLSVLLVTMKKIGEKPKRIGFILQNK